MKNDKTTTAEGRVIGLDSHPDSFTAAMVRGPNPAAAIIEKTFDQIPMSRLESWARKHTTPEDLFVLEASGNSFQVVRTLRKMNRRAEVLGITRETPLFLWHCPKKKLRKKKG